MSGKVPIIGRLHQVETASGWKEFASFKPGDKIEAKVLRKIEEDGKTMIELTRRPQHLNSTSESGLDSELCKLLTFETLGEGQEVEALVTDVVTQD